MTTPSLIEQRQVRVFISSTFQDMAGERDYLMKRTFPLLRRLAAERDVTLTELDLRWGITPEEAESGKVVEICLREIENSVPFFIGIIGNRYGWVPSAADLGESLRERFPRVEDYVARGLSVTEMEMQFGVLERPEDMHAYFYIKADEAEQDNAAMLARLKAKVRASRYPSATYSSFEDLGRQVEAAFRALLDRLFPEGHLTEQERGHLAQRTHRNSLCTHYIRDERNFQVLDEWLAAGESPQLVVTGPSGMGKSALIANWLRDLEARKDQPYRVAYHFVGNGGNEGSHGQIAHALAGEIRAAYGFEDKELDVLFQRVSTEGDRPLLVVLDAVNQIADVDNAKQLGWLPNVPKNVRILFSTLEADATMDVFRNRKYPLFTLQPLDLDKRRRLVVDYLSSFGKRLQPAQVEHIVTDGQCANTLVLRTLLDELLNFGIFERLDERIDYFLRRTTIEDFYAALLASYEADYAASGPDFVRHILTLLAVSRSGLSEAELLGILNIGAPADAPRVSPLHWAQFFCAFRAHLAVHGGLITFGHSYVRSAVETRYNVAAATEARLEIAAHFSGQTTPRALHELPHQLYALGDDRRLHDVLLDIDVFEHLYTTDLYALANYWVRLQGEYSLEEYLPLATGERRAVQLVMLSTFCSENVVVPAAAIRFAERMVEVADDEQDQASAMLMMANALNTAGDYTQSLDYGLKALAACRGILGERNDITATFYNNVGMTYKALGDYPKALDYLQRALDINRAVLGDQHPQTASAYSNVGSVYSDLDDPKRALAYETKALEMRRAVFGEQHPDTALAYNNVALTHRDLGDDDTALAYLQKAIEALRTTYGDRHPHAALFYTNAAQIYTDRDEDEQALEYNLRALEIYETLYGEQHPDTVEALSDVGCGYNNVGMTYKALGDYPKALDHLQRALDINRAVLGEQHPKTATVYMNLGSVYGLLEDHQQALAYETKALEIHRAVYGEQHPDTALAYNNVALTHRDLGDDDTALAYLQKAIEALRTTYGDRHPHAAMFYTNAAQIYTDRDEDEQALEYNLQALEIYEALYGEQHPDTVEALSDVGCGYACVGQYAKALENLHRCVSLASANGDEATVAQSLNVLAATYSVVGDVAAAIEHYERTAAAYRGLGDEEAAAEIEQQAAQLRAEAQPAVSAPQPEGSPAATSGGGLWGLVRRWFGGK